MKRIHLPFYRCSAIMAEYKEFGEESFLVDKRELPRRDLILDDIGAEPARSTNYGNHWDLSEWLCWREECWTRYGTITLMTTNLDGASTIRTRYGERIVSRILGMNDVIRYEYTDRRKEDYMARNKLQ